MSEDHSFRTEIPNIWFSKVKILGPYLFQKIFKYSMGECELSLHEWLFLEKNDIAEKVSLNETKIIDLLSNKTPQKIPNLNKTCEWCSGNSYVLQNHHYPIAQSKGGKEVVRICANCHCEFHYLMDHKKYEIKEEYKFIFVGDENE